MVPIDRGHTRMGPLDNGWRVGIVHTPCPLVIHRVMVCLEGQDISGPLLRHGRGDRLLTPHGLTRHGRPWKVSERQACGESREVMGRGLHCELLQSQTIGRRPRADQRPRGFGGGMSKGMAEGLAVSRPDGAMGQVAEGLTPGEAPWSACVRGHARYPASEGVIPRQTRRHVQHCFAPLGWGFAVCCEVFPARRATANRTAGQNEPSAQLVASLGPPRSGESSTRRRKRGGGQHPHEAIALWEKGSSR